MKHQFYLLPLVVFYLLISGCSIEQGDTEEVTNDTMICKKKIQDHLVRYCTYEYFIVSKGDTSLYSFICRSQSAYPHDCNMEIMNWPRYKQYLIPKNTIISCYKPNYKDFPKEMDLCLDVALNERDSINLKYIVFRLVNCTDIVTETSNLFYKMRRKDLTHQNVLDALQKTSLKEDSSRILKEYNLHVTNENYYEEIYFVKKSDFLNISSYSNKREVPNSILDVNVNLDIAHM